MAVPPGCWEESRPHGMVGVHLDTVRVIIVHPGLVGFACALSRGYSAFPWAFLAPLCRFQL
jgi:hypothetical protein